MNKPASRFSRFLPVRFRQIFIFVIVAVTAMGCMHRYGRLSVDGQVGKNFREGVMRSDYHYFYTGRDTMPYAVVGIDGHYILSSPYWLPIGSDSEKISKMSGAIFGEDKNDPYGAYILASDGTVVGEWYSNLLNYSIIVNKTDHSVMIFLENPEKDDTYR